MRRIILFFESTRRSSAGKHWRLFFLHCCAFSFVFFVCVLFLLCVNDIHVLQGRNHIEDLVGREKKHGAREWS